MKKLLIVFVTIIPLWCMESGAPNDQALAPFNEHITTQYLLDLATLVESSPRKRPFGSLDPIELAQYAETDPEFHKDVAMADAVALHNQEEMR